jgi:flagellar basal body rod protein FlgB
MNEIKDNALMAALGRQMTQAVQKQAVSAGEVSFGDLLDGEVSRLELAQTSPLHLGGSGSTRPDVHETEGLESRRDGNNVQIDRELLTMTRASSEFAAAQSALSAKFRVIRFAIKGD